MKRESSLLQPPSSFRLFIKYAERQTIRSSRMNFSSNLNSSYIFRPAKYSILKIVYSIPFKVFRHLTVREFGTPKYWPRPNIKYRFNRILSNDIKELILIEISDVDERNQVRIRFDRVKKLQLNITTSGYRVGRTPHMYDVSHIKLLRPALTWPPSPLHHQAPRGEQTELGAGQREANSFHLELSRPPSL